MIVLVQASVLTIGLDDKTGVLRELPIRVIGMRTGAEAACYLRNGQVNSVISRWDLEDAKDGWFLRRLKAVKPRIPTIVFVRGGSVEQEIEARSLGVSAVLTDETSDELFRETVAGILGLKQVVNIKEISSPKRRRSKTRIRR